MMSPATSLPAGALLPDNPRPRVSRVRNRQAVSPAAWLEQLEQENEMNANATTVTINSRMKLGFGWSNSPMRTYRSDGQSAGLVIDTDDTPREFGTIRQMAETHIPYAARINNGNDWTYSLYVRVDGQWHRIGRDMSRAMVSDYEMHRDYDHESRHRSLRRWFQRTSRAWCYELAI